jgi:hypothetical protein
MSLEKQNIIFAQTPEEQASLEAEAIKTEDVKRDPERQQKSTPGVGTDIFVRKKRPGSQVGKGYFVDIYENGVKIDTIELATKKDVTKLIRKFKDKYNTDRAFQNEMQVHITYKTKKERGEPMASIDTILIRKAHKIQELLNKLTEPELPLIKRFGQEDLLGDVNSVPETPPTGTEDKEKIKRYIADEIVKKFVDFVKKKTETESEEINEPDFPINTDIAASHQTKHKSAALDDIFNPLRKWYGTLARKIEEWNNMSNNMLNETDIQDIVKQTETILLSQNPQLIQKNTGISISPETAQSIYEVGSKSVGKPGDAEKGGELGGNPADFQDELGPKAAKVAKKDEKQPTIENTNDLLHSFTKNVQTQISSMAISDIAKDLNVVDNDILQKMHSILSEKDDLVEAEAAIQKYIEDQLNIARTSSLHPSIIESKTKEFWKFAGDYKGIANIEDVFIDWIRKTGYDLKKAANIWEQINEDIMKVFNFDKIKTANKDRAVGDIIYTADGIKIFEGWLEYRGDMDRIGLNTTQELTWGNSPAYKTLHNLTHTSEDILNEQQLLATTSEILPKYASQEVIESIAKDIFKGKETPTAFTVTISARDAEGGSSINEQTFNFNISPFAEDVIPA